jgi:hypothetical protein
MGRWVASVLIAARSIRAGGAKMLELGAVLALALMVPARVIAGAIDTHRANLIFNWAIPVALVLWAVKAHRGGERVGRRRIRERKR